jgi:L-threonylcarbamoyladenylate synthase
MTRLLPPDAGGIAEAAGLLHGGALVAFATETVYGLGADARQGRAVAGIFAAKGRPRFNPLICHFSCPAAAFAEVEANDMAARLAALFWPGPLTMVLRRRATSRIDLLAGAGLDTLAVRVPAHAAARALIAAAGEAIAAPSANRSGGVSPTEAGHVMADLGGRIAAVLDCGPAALGIESTVLDVSGGRPRLLRPGGLPVEAIEAAIGAVSRGITTAQAETAQGLRSPGLLVSHYAPRLPLRLVASDPLADEALLAFGASPPAAPLVWNLSDSGDVTEAASRLFAGLRWLDARAPALGLAGIAAMPVPMAGLGAAINDRLQRAAAPR